MGPMDHDREAGKQWRIDMAAFLKYELKVIPVDPYHKPVMSMQDSFLESEDAHIERREAIERGDRGRVKELMTPIVASDLRIVDRCDFGIVYLDLDKRPCGSYDEIFTMSNQRKPVIVMCPQGVSKIPPWLYGRLRPELFFDDWTTVKLYLHHINSSPFEDIETMKKWKFFDFEPLIMEILEIIKKEENNDPSTW